MIYTEMTKRALSLCFEAHKDQKDKSGLPYVFHPFHLAEQMEDEETTVVALLHDVIEDTEYTIEDLQKVGFSQSVISAIALMTHDPQVPYMEYVRAIKSNPIARAVKLADLRHNSDMTRLDIITQRDEERAQKYLDAIVVLEEAGLVGAKENGKKKQVVDEVIVEDIVPTDYCDEISTSFIDYAVSVITDRALPDVRDGLKPVHRRILWAMKNLGLSSSGDYKKAARAQSGDGSVIV